MGIDAEASLATRAVCAFPTTIASTLSRTSSARFGTDPDSLRASILKPNVPSSTYFWSLNPSLGLKNWIVRTDRTHEQTNNWIAGPLLRLGGKWRGEKTGS